MFSNYDFSNYDSIVDEQFLLEKLNKEYYYILRKTGMEFVRNKIKQSNNNIFQTRKNVFACLCYDLGFSFQIDISSKSYVLISIIKYENSQIILNEKGYESYKRIPISFRIYKSTPIKETIKKIEKEIKKVKMQYQLKNNLIK